MLMFDRVKKLFLLHPEGYRDFTKKTGKYGGLQLNVVKLTEALSFDLMHSDEA